MQCVHDSVSLMGNKHHEIDYLVGLNVYLMDNSNSEIQKDKHSIIS